MEAFIATVDDTAKLSKSLERARYELQQERRLNKALLRNTGLTFESAIDGLKEYLETSPLKPFKIIFKAIPQHKTSVKSVFDEDHSETGVLMLSDFHTAEVVSPLETNGMNKFNPLILSNRLWDLCNKFIKIIRGHQAMYQIDKLWIPLLGDFISGSIHNELALTNALLDYPSAVLAAQLIILVVERLKCLGLPIEMDAVVGNHARSTEKLTTKKQAQLSLDWIVYVMVEMHFRNDPQVSIAVHQSQFALVNQRGHGFVLDHGAGYPYNKLEELDSRVRSIFENPEYREAVGPDCPNVSTVLLADKHRASRGPNHIVNASCVGASEITTSWRLRPIRPEQVTFGISDSNPITWDYPLLINSKRETLDNPFSCFVHEFMAINGR